jgi:GAF domain-containing protein
MDLRAPLDAQHAPVVKAFHTRRGLVVNTLHTSLAAHPELSAFLPAAALLVVPLLATTGPPIGVLSLSEAVDPERFDTENLEQVRVFAVQATLAIEIARLHAVIRIAQTEAEGHRARWQAAIDDLPALVCT